MFGITTITVSSSKWSDIINNLLFFSISTKQNNYDNARWIGGKKAIPSVTVNVWICFHLIGCILRICCLFLHFPVCLVKKSGIWWYIVAVKRLLRFSFCYLKTCSWMQKKSWKPFSIFEKSFSHRCKPMHSKQNFIGYFSSSSSRWPTIPSWAHFAETELSNKTCDRAWSSDKRFDRKLFPF